MDAISFVLGVRTNQLRGHQLKELLYTNSEGNTEQCKPRTGFVKLAYVTEAAETVVFSRHIQPSSSELEAAHQSVYKINSRYRIASNAISPSALKIGPQFSFNTQDCHLGSLQQ
jgi:chromosome segregation ATPase